MQKNPQEHAQLQGFTDWDYSKIKKDAQLQEFYD